jgi:hypothetical protein
VAYQQSSFSTFAGQQLLLKYALLAANAWIARMPALGSVLVQWACCQQAAAHNSSFSSQAGACGGCTFAMVGSAPLDLVPPWVSSCCLLLLIVSGHLRQEAELYFLLVQDFDAPASIAYPDTSAAAIASLGFLILDSITGNHSYFIVAHAMLSALSAPPYLATQPAPPSVSTTATTDPTGVQAASILGWGE